MKTVQEKLKQARFSKGLTTREVGAAVGISANMVSLAENTKAQELSPRVIRLLSGLYHLDGEKLVSQYAKEHSAYMAKKKAEPSANTETAAG